jgi:hypothetical protein
MLTNWLYGVAHNTALKARAMSRKRRIKETEAGTEPKPQPTVEDWQELQELLDGELSRLPDKYRVPIVLCDLEGRTIKEAARHLGWPQGTVATRLARGRGLLRKRLSQRGLFLSGGLAVALAGGRTAAVSSPLLLSTVKAACLLAAGRATAGVVSSTAATLMEGVLKTMLLSKLKIATAVLVGMGFLLGLGLAAPGWSAWAQPGEDKPSARPTAANPRADEPPGQKPAWRENFVMTHDHPVALIACNQDWIAVADEGGNLFLWDAKTGKEQTHRIKGGKGEGLTTSVDRLQFMPDGKSLYAVLGGRRGLGRFNLEKGNKTAGGVWSREPHFLGVSADGETWLEAHRGGRTLALRPNPWTQRGAAAEFELVDFGADIVHAVPSADDKWLAVATVDGKLHLHDRSSLKETQTIETKQRTVACVQFSPDGSRVAVVGHDAPAKVYDVTNGNEVATLKGHSGIVFTVAFSPDGKTVATGGDDNTAQLWDAATGKELAVLKGHKDSVRSVSFDPSGEMLVTGSADKTVKTWKLSK